MNGFLFDDVSCANSLDKFEALTPEHHVRRVLSESGEVSPMRLTPVLKRAVTFTLIVSKCFIHFIETSLGQLDRFEDGFRDALPVENDHHFSELCRK